MRKQNAKEDFILNISMLRVRNVQANTVLSLTVLQMQFMAQIRFYHGPEIFLKLPISPISYLALSNIVKRS